MRKLYNMLEVYQEVSKSPYSFKANGVGAEIAGQYGY